MAFTLIQAGTSLQLSDTSGALTTLTLPAGITLSSSLTPRFAIFNQYVVMVNSPSRPITIDGSGTVRVLTPNPPATQPSLTTAAGGGLTGTYTGVKQTFIVKDAYGNIIAESGFGPAATTSASPSSQYLKAFNLSTSLDTISGSRLYRPTTGGDGSVLFHWVDIDGNTQTSISDDTPDAGISLVAAPTLGSVPDLSLICEWRGRLWGVAKNDIDTLRYTESAIMYAWVGSNTIPIPKIGADTRGITAFIPRREQLGIGRRNILQQITGTSSSDFRVIKISENLGVESQESVVVFKDVAYWIWKDGVYQWDNDGVRCISDGKVRAWFNTDTYFNRAKFSSSFAQIDPLRNKYRLFLAAAGSSTINRWIEYDLISKTWWGPHKTDAFTPTCAITLQDANDTLLPMIGSSNGFLWKDQTTRTDGTSTAISSAFVSKFHDAQAPDIDKYWGELSVIGKAQPTGTISIIPTLGYTNSSASSTINYDMTKGRQRLPRLGIGKLCQLNFSHATAGQNVELYGYEIPVSELGRR